MRQFVTAFFGGFSGKIVAALVLVYLASVGFGPDWIVQMLTGWLADPLSLSLVVLRIFAILIVIIIVASFALPRFWRPKFRIEFVAERDLFRGVTLTDSRTGRQLADKATYVHVQVYCVGRSNITDCCGWITCIERLDSNKKTLAILQETRPLVWAPREFGATHVAIQSKAPRDLDIFTTVENANRLQLLSIGHPVSWDNFFDLPATYRITISVSGDGHTQTIRLLVAWRGHSNDFGIEVDRS